MWRNLDAVNLMAGGLGSVLRATLSRASCTALIVASGVNGIVFVLHSGGASSSRTHSVIVDVKC